MTKANTHGGTETRPTAALGGNNGYPDLDAADVHNCLAAISHYRRTVPQSPPSILRTADRLTRLLASPRGHGNRSDAPQSEGVGEFIGTRLAARLLGCSERTVRRNADALGGRRAGRDLIYPADRIRELAAEGSPRCLTSPPKSRN